MVSRVRKQRASTMPPKSQKRVVVASRETRLAKMKEKEKEAASAAGAAEPAGGGSGSSTPRPLSAAGKKKGMPGMSKKGDARRKAAAEAAKAAAAANAAPASVTRFDAGLSQLPDPAASQNGGEAGGVVNNETAVLSRSAGVYLERAAEATRVLALVKASGSTRAPAQRFKKVFKCLGMIFKSF